MGQEEVDVSLGERGMPGVGPHEIDQRPVEHEHAQVRRALQGGQPAEQLGRDPDDVEEVLALLAAPFQVAQDHRVVAELLPLRETALSRLDAVRSDAQQDGELAGDLHLPDAPVDEGDHLPLQLGPTGALDEVGSQDGVRALAAPGLFHRLPDVGDELCGVLEVVVTQALGDEQRILRQAHHQLRLPEQILLHPCFGETAALGIGVCHALSALPVTLPPPARRGRRGRAPAIRRGRARRVAGPAGALEPQP